MNRSILIAVVFVTGAVALAGCSAGPDSKEQFLSEVRAQLDTGFSDSELVSLARDACDAVADGGGQQALQRLAMASGMTAYDYGVVVGQGVNHLCSEQQEAFRTIVG